MARKPAKPADDAAALPAGTNVADLASPKPPVPAIESAAAQVQAGVGGAPAETHEGADAAPVNTSAEDGTTEVATQMPEETAAVPPAAGNAPAATTLIAVVDLVVIVRGPAKGRWRAGRHFTPEPVTIPLDDLNEDEKAALIGDPELTVTTTTA